LREALDVGVVLCFDHDAGELLRAGIAEDDTAIFAESELGFGEGAGNFGERFERGLGFYFDVDDDLRVVLEALDERFDFAAHGNERSDFDGGEKAVAGGAIFEKNDVAGLFASEDVAAAEHFLENIAIADGSAGERDAFAGEDALEAEIGHGRGDDAIALEFILGFEMTGDGEENAIAVDDFSGFADEESAVGIAIKGDAKTGAFGDDALLQTLEMERTAAVVDVAAVGGNAHGDDVGAESAEEFGAELVGGAVGAVEDDAETGEAGSGEDASAEKIEIFGVERGVGRGDGWILGRRIGAMLEDFRFELLLDGIGKLHAGVGEKLYAVVLIRIVGSGDDDACLKIILADEASDARSGDDAGKSDRGAGFGESGGEKGSEMRAGFARVHADENMSRGMFAEKIGGERAADGEKGGVIEGRSARDAANAIGSEKFFGHEKLTFRS
jgi:hypothetical protein